MEIELKNDTSFKTNWENIFYRNNKLERSLPNTKFWEGRKEGNVLFNDALNTFYLQLYGVRHMVKDHSDSERGNPLPPHGMLLWINSKFFFICTIKHTG